ncbi:hypothetical protein [Chelativorans salis]|uniref:Uncharacterized protein n=1 Tax=Chelativorans salis TaxID=2978478 RepID=A0ABT2LGF5_9HYPH|nr:hypothetical protein [Chelativorans sp. EGI FJ00035]MCT7373485.1 hypothetical protein [Chelativorans sp. EGI FJ00035]
MLIFASFAISVIYASYSIYEFYDLMPYDIMFNILLFAVNFAPIFLLSVSSIFSDLDGKIAAIIGQGIVILIAFQGYQHAGDIEIHTAIASTLADNINLLLNFFFQYLIAISTAIIAVKK